MGLELPPRMLHAIPAFHKIVPRGLLDTSLMAGYRPTSYERFLPIELNENV